MELVLEVIAEGLLLGGDRFEIVVFGHLLARPGLGPVELSGRAAGRGIDGDAEALLQTLDLRHRDDARIDVLQGADETARTRLGIGYTGGAYVEPVVVSVLAPQPEFDIDVAPVEGRRVERVRQRRALGLMCLREQVLARGLEFAVRIAEQLEGPGGSPERRLAQVRPVKDALAGARHRERETFEHRRFAFARQA